MSGKVTRDGEQIREMAWQPNTVNDGPERVSPRDRIKRGSRARSTVTYLVLLKGEDYQETDG